MPRKFDNLIILKPNKQYYRITYYYLLNLEVFNCLPFHVHLSIAGDAFHVHGQVQLPVIISHYVHRHLEEYQCTSPGVAKILYPTHAYSSKTSHL